MTRTVTPPRDMLLGLLAVEHGVIDRDQLVSALQRWAHDRTCPLVDHLVAQGYLGEDERRYLEGLTDNHLARHGGDMKFGLAALPAGSAVREAIARICDADIDGTMTCVGSGSTGLVTDPDRTCSFVGTVDDTVGTATSAGQRFRILRPHARGGLGAVFLALDSELNREVALKQILDSHADDPASRQRFLLEAEVTGGLEHPGIVPVYGLGTYADGRPYYAMRFIRGESLKEPIDRFHADETLRHDPGRRSLELRKLLRRFHDVCNAVEYAHSRGVLHRDLKPNNIMIGKYGETLVVDWGLAKVIGRADPALVAGEQAMTPSSSSDLAKTLPGSVVGTPAYMSPEQASGELERLGPRSDVYSLGATLHYLLTGAPPFTGDDLIQLLGRIRQGEFSHPRKLDPTLDRALEAVCLKAMALQPEDRYGSARALAEDIERWAADEPVDAHPEGWRARLSRWTRRHRTWMQAAVAVLVIVAGVSACAALLINHAREHAELAHRNEQQAHLEASTAAVAEKEQREQAVKSLHEVKQLSARWALDRGLTLCEQGRPDLGMLWLARGLRLAPDDDSEIQRVLRLNLGGWAREFHHLRQAFPLPADVTAAAMSPDGRVLLVGCMGRGIHFWDVHHARTLCRPARLPAEVRVATFSPDSRIGLTGGDDGTARLWDAATGGSLAQPLVHEAEVRVAAFSPDGRTVLTGSDDGKARLWDAASGQPLGIPLEHRGWVTALAFRADGKTILTGSSDQSARLWDAASGRLQGQPMDHHAAVTAVAFQPGGPLAATAAADGHVQIWEVRTGMARGRPLVHPDGVPTLAFRHDGQVLLTACLDGAARLWDVATGRQVGSPMQHRDRVSAAALSPDGQTVLTASDDATARLWEAATGRPLGQPLVHHGPIRAIAFGPEGRFFVTVGGDKAARLWETAPGLGHGRAMDHESAVVSLAVSADSRLLLTGSMGRTARLWDAATGGPLGPPLPHLSHVAHVALSPDGRRALTGGRNGTAHLWDPAAGTPIGPPLAHRIAITAVTISPDGRVALTGSADGTARLWDAETGRPGGPLMGHSGVVTVATFRPDGETAITGSLDGGIRFWDSRTGLIRRRPVTFQGHIHGLAVSGDGRTILVGGDSHAWLCDGATGEVRGEPLAHRGNVSAAAFLADGSAVATYSDDGAIRSWNVETGQPLGPPRSTGGTRSQVFSPRADMLLGGRDDGTARLWDVATGHLLGPPLRHRSEVPAVAFRPDGRLAVTGDARAARLWTVPEPAAGTPERILLRVQVLTNARLEEDDAIRVMDVPAWDEFRRRLNADEGAQDTTQFIGADPSSTASPGVRAD